MKIKDAVYLIKLCDANIHSISDIIFEYNNKNNIDIGLQIGTQISKKAKIINHYDKNITKKIGFKIIKTARTEIRTGNCYYDISNYNNYYETSDSLIVKNISYLYTYLYIMSDKDCKINIKLSITLIDKNILDELKDLKIDYLYGITIINDLAGLRDNYYDQNKISF